MGISKRLVSGTSLLEVAELSSQPTCLKDCDPRSAEPTGTPTPEQPIRLTHKTRAKANKGDGYLAHEEFKGMVSSLDIKLSGEQMRSAIRAI
ncbi:MAG: hypothetical protein AAF202_04330, partial [Pseudomonadota bacterium]